MRCAFGGNALRHDTSPIHYFMQAAKACQDEGSTHHVKGGGCIDALPLRLDDSLRPLLDQFDFDSAVTL